MGHTPFSIPYTHPHHHIWCVWCVSVTPTHGTCEPPSFFLGLGLPLTRLARLTHILTRDSILPSSTFHVERVVPADTLVPSTVDDLTAGPVILLYRGLLVDLVHRPPPHQTTHPPHPRRLRHLAGRCLHVGPSEAGFAYVVSDGSIGSSHLPIRRNSRRICRRCNTQPQHRRVGSPTATRVTWTTYT